ncbi:MAG: putative N-glycosylase/DNA lyase [Promethearchaeota archaeon]|nr:MAG: putative N-glycosylase/DNA lyase [Candidatus Lokiarchaeota archaeon]
MENIRNAIKGLQKSKIQSTIQSRLREFSEIREKEIDEIFIELCFCIMTANCGAEKCIEVHEQIQEDFLTISQKELAKTFKRLGYRFPNIRSEYVVEARKKKAELEEQLNDSQSEKNLRKWIVNNVKGLGWKESSHFLRNIGFKNLAIIDRHIIDILVSNNLVEEYKTITRKRYLEMEEILENLGKELDLNLAELDLYLWYLETGKILK